MINRDRVPGQSHPAIVTYRDGEVDVVVAGASYPEACRYATTLRRYGHTNVSVRDHGDPSPRELRGRRKVTNDDVGFDV